MENNCFTVEEICEHAYNYLQEHGYKPEYQSDDLDFVCMINGIRFSFAPSDDEYFWYGAEFELKIALPEDVQRRLAVEFSQIYPENVVFENLHIIAEGTLVCLSCMLPCSFYELDLIERAVEMLESAQGIAAQLKAWQK